jgi:hypothetical protein
MDSIFITAAVFTVLGFGFGYWRGFGAGIAENMVDHVIKLLEALPLNLELNEDDGMFYARLMGTGVFVGQSRNKNDLLQMARQKFPNRTIVFSMNQESDD